MEVVAHMLRIPAGVKIIPSACQGLRCCQSRRAHPQRTPRGVCGTAGTGLQLRTLSTTSSTPGGFRYAEKSPPLLIQASGSVSFSTNTTRFGQLPYMIEARPEV